MLPRNHPDRVHIAFDDHGLIANAGLVPPIILDHHLGMGEWGHARLGCHRPPMGFRIATFDELQPSVDRQRSRADSEHEPVSGPKTAPASWKPNSGGSTTDGDYTQPCLNSYRWLEEKPQCRP